MDLKEYLRHGTGTPKCYSCKQNLKITPENIDEFIYYDGHFYHNECFKQDIKVKRKCNFCKKEIVLEYKNNTSVFYNEKMYHSDCFDKWCHATKTPSKVRLTALSNKEKFIKDSEELAQSLYQKKCNISPYQIKEETRRIINQKFSEQRVNNFIKLFYDIYSIPSSVWKKLSQLYNGTYHKFDGILPPEDLLDMFEQKQEFLSKINAKLQSKQEWTAEGLINYDLAVLLNKYNDYLAWKERVKLMSVTEDDTEPTENLTISMSVSNNYNSNKQETENNNNDEIVNLVDDIFGE